MKHRHTPEWKDGENLGRQFAHGLRGGDCYADALVALDKAIQKYPDAFSQGLAGFCQGVAQAMWRRQRRAGK